MGGGLMGLICADYAENIQNKQPLQKRITSETQLSIKRDELHHLSMICYTLLRNQDSYDTSHFIHAIQEMEKILCSYET
jgi:hypothetical protein